MCELNYCERGGSGERLLISNRTKRLTGNVATFHKCVECSNIDIVIAICLREVLKSSSSSVGHKSFTMGGDVARAARE